MYWAECRQERNKNLFTGIQTVPNLNRRKNKINFTAESIIQK